MQRSFSCACLCGHRPIGLTYPRACNDARHPQPLWLWCWYPSLEGWAADPSECPEFNQSSVSQPTQKKPTFQFYLQKVVVSLLEAIQSMRTGTNPPQQAGHKIVQQKPTIHKNLFQLLRFSIPGKHPISEHQFHVYDPLQLVNSLSPR